MDQPQSSTERAAKMRELIDRINSGAFSFPQIRDEALNHILFDAPTHEWWGVDLFPADPMHVKYKMVYSFTGDISAETPALQELDKLFRDMITATVSSFENYCTSQAISDKQGNTMTYESVMEALKLLPKHKTYIFVTHKDDWDDLMRLFTKGEYIVVPDIPSDIDPKYEDAIIGNTTRFKAVLWNDVFDVGLETDFWELEGGVPGKILAIDEQAIRPPLGWRR